MSELPFAAVEVGTRLLAWYEDCGRDLPWRHTRDPYAIWLSEIMLQQTGVETVIPYYRTFLEHYPAVQDLAAASVEEVIEQWSGLGYYRRARNLHAAARRVTQEHGGLFPDSLEGLQSLPGVGRSTAAAILSIAFDVPAAILDGNVRRVLCRLFALQGDPRASAAEKQLWGWAEALTSRERPHDYAQAIMDLGATLCTPRQPACARCPLAGLCQGHRQGIAEQLPQPRARRQLPQRQQVALLLEHDGKVLVCRRGLDGMLGGLWEFPNRDLDGEETADSVAVQLALELGGGVPQAVGRIKHVYSHFGLTVQLFMSRTNAASRVEEEGACRWLTHEELSQLALHGAHQKALTLYNETRSPDEPAADS